MHLRGVPVRRSFKTKILLLSLIFATFIFYIKFITNNNSGSIDPSNGDAHYNNNNRKLIAGKLIGEYNGDNAVESTNFEYQPLPADDGGGDDDGAVVSIKSQNLQHKSKTEQNEIYDQWIRTDLAKQVHGLGDNGRKATLTNPTAKGIGERQLAKIALNEELSEHLSYNRTLDDARNPLCRTQHYNLNDLPTTSIVIIFYNEPYSVLVRTVHSVLNTVDRRLLKEIILVDDSSTNSELKEKLDYYIETRLPQNIVKIIRLKHR